MDFKNCHLSLANDLWLISFLPKLFLRTFAPLVEGDFQGIVTFI
jgi:hypothetical protein